MVHADVGAGAGAAPSFTEDHLRPVVGRAADRVGVAHPAVELIRIGSNAVFRLGRDVVARVAPSSRLLGNARRQIAVARWLAEVDYPATRALAVDQPVEIDGVVVTFWESISRGEVYAPLADVGRLIRRLHELSRPEGLDLPALAPFGHIGDPLPPFEGLDEIDAAYLRSRIEWSREAFSDMPFALPAGHIHGDANVGNVICDDLGAPVLIDLDSFATGAREWDLIQTALFYDRLGWHDGSEYRDFVDSYGYDLMQWTGYATLADMREIAMTSWIAKKAATSTGAAAEATKRVAAIRTGGSRRDWGAY
ncbi:aminoglycoside phosphotransferase family protein [Pseudonocardia sp. EV170527-09]|uniref:phosphotransferase enzyme family protein n=1 Tax=Pseudonocardia sp. EV170527-09 TaxID=2603411 RepID=UPI0011F2F885|nr:aminoglycoside phosphotransferase family protein [Pseudonocardia sp. EV170527-09]KAA1027092.1 aminoglycoside phosphotransferase family protein [Pseudonocardia sp. EV170527-09]